MSPCAHASWFPTRHASQTTSSLIARLDPGHPKVWATGTSSPCLSVFKPVPFDAALFPLHPIEDEGYEAARLWWAHERLHRACLQDYQSRRAVFEEDRQRFQDDCLRPEADPLHAWKEHRPRIDAWLERALAVNPSRAPFPTRLYWKKQSRASAMPA
jgi:dipeptidase